MPRSFLCLSCKDTDGNGLLDRIGLFFSRKMDNESNEPNQTPKHSISPAIKAKLLPAMLHVHGVHDDSAALYEYWLLYGVDRLVHAPACASAGAAKKKTAQNRSMLNPGYMNVRVGSGDVHVRTYSRNSYVRIGQDAAGWRQGWCVGVGMDLPYR